MSTTSLNLPHYLHHHSPHQMLTPAAANSTASSVGPMKKQSKRLSTGSMAKTNGGGQNENFSPCYGGGTGGGRENHHPHRPQASSVARRNERERNRVKMVNMGFATLRQHVPHGSKNKKMSKVETLRSAVEYIRELQKLLGQNTSGNGNNNNENLIPFHLAPDSPEDGNSCSSSNNGNIDIHQTQLGGGYYDSYSMQVPDTPNTTTGEDSPLDSNCSSLYSSSNTTTTPPPPHQHSIMDISSATIDNHHHHHHQQQQHSHLQTVSFSGYNNNNNENENNNPNSSEMNNSSSPMKTTISSQYHQLINQLGNANNNNTNNNNSTTITTTTTTPTKSSPSSSFIVVISSPNNNENNNNNEQHQASNHHSNHHHHHHHQELHPHHHNHQVLMDHPQLTTTPDEYGFDFGWF